MKLLHIIEPLKAGILTALETLVQHTPQMEHSIVYDVSRSESFAYLQEKFPDVRLFPASLPRSSSPGKCFSSFCELIKIIENSSYDLVHCHSSMAGVWGRLAARYCGVPAFYTPHSFAFLRTDISAMQKYFFWLAEYLLCPLSHTVLACGLEEYHCAQKFLLGEKRAKLMQNSLDLGYFSCFKGVESTGITLRIGTNGRVAPQKGPELFCRLAHNFSKKAEWVWIGAEKNNELLNSRVQCTGWVSREKSLDLVKSLDIYVQTSLWEGLSYALLEAMALGKAVVVSDIPANRDVVEHGVTGFLCSHEGDYLAALQRLQNDASLRQKIGKNAQEYVLKNHDASANYMRLAQLYRAAV